MLFKGRTVAAFMALTMAGSVLITLTVTEKYFSLTAPAPAAGAVSASSAAGKGGLTPKELDKLNTVMELIENKYFTDINREQLVDGALSGMVEALGDPYSTYMEKNIAEQFSETVEGSFTGVGAEITMEDGNIVVVSAIKNSPAERAGLLAKDIVLSVNGQSMSGLPLKEAVAKLRGPKGSQAKLQIRRAGMAQPIQLVLVRDDIDVETVYGSLRPDGVGIIEIRQFSLNTAKRFADELGELEKKGMKALLIDVRNNPGGVLPVVEKIVEPLIPSGKTIVQVQYRGAPAERAVSKGKGKSYPIAVLINKGSASASEILAGALKESAGAVVVGETSYGKGTVQISYDNGLGGDLVKMTVAKWLTPDGNWVHEKGIKPDVPAAPPSLYTVARLAKAKTLQPDTIGDEVKSLQTMLQGLGFDPGRKDGYYSRETAEAVMAFQTSGGLEPTGIADVKTQQSLEQAARKWVRCPQNDSQLAKAIETLKARLGGGQ
ncbi:S41 family peptidase [Paenibacillus beijingensis]|uniref:Peptidase S41 n=1 Tax=Paenibacillus beijingensis TaxID=1126833 RepID=A0A0D5NHN0_9BACL|nr:S41 family peptidase [Paenibacillus beijingensis]AJY74487.1 peptidase S41 [Paenibacillus beijingensis]